MCYCVLEARILQRGINPASVPPLPRLSYRHPAGHPMVESAQHPLHMRRQDPFLWPVYQDRLHHHQVNMYICLFIRSLSAQYLIQPRPLLSGAPEVAHYFRPAVFLCRKKLPQILEGGNLVEGYYIGSECPLCPLPCLLLCQATPLPLHSLSA